MTEIGVQITNFRKFEKGSLRGFFDVELPSGIVLRECSLHEKDGKRWINPPSRKIEKQGSQATWKRMVDFASSKTASQFRDAVLDALDTLLQPPDGPTPEITEEDIPF